MYWLATAAFVLHVVEEFPHFPAWATRHFGATSRPWYVYSHIPLIVGTFIISHFAATSDALIWRLLATAVVWTLFSNALFHLATTILFREYSPGVVTGTTVFLPLTWWFTQQVVAAKLMSPAQLQLAILLGLLAGVVVIASLWLPMNIDWRFRKTT